MLLGPGDALLVPAYWFVHTQLLGDDEPPIGGLAGADVARQPATRRGAAGGAGGSAALVIQLRPAPAPRAPAAPGEAAAAVMGEPAPARLPSAGALQLQAGRMIEAVVAREVGAANVRKWLQVCEWQSQAPVPLHGAPAQ